MRDWQRLRGKFIVLDGGEGCGKSTQAHKLLHFLQDTHHLPVLLLRDPGTTAVGEKIRHILLDPANTDMAMRCEMLLYMAARAQMMHEIIRPALSRGEVVLSDRFISSTLAYQLGGGGLTREEILAVAEVALGGRHEGTEARRHEGAGAGGDDAGTTEQQDAGPAGGETNEQAVPSDPSLRASVPSCLRALPSFPDLTLLFDLPVELSQARVRPKFVALFKDAGDLPDPSRDRIEQRPVEYHRQVRQNYLAQARAQPDRYALIDASRDPDAVFADVLKALGRVTA